MNIRLAISIIGIVLIASFGAYVSLSQKDESIQETAQIVDSIEIKEKTTVDTGFEERLEETASVAEKNDLNQEIESILENFDKIEEERTALDDLNPFSDNGAEASEEGN